MTTQGSAARMQRLLAPGIEGRRLGLVRREGDGKVRATGGDGDKCRDLVAWLDATG